MAKAKKERAEKYDSKLGINGTFFDVINASALLMPTDKKVQPKKDKSKRSLNNEMVSASSDWLHNLHSYILSDCNTNLQLYLIFRWAYPFSRMNKLVPLVPTGK